MKNDKYKYVLLWVKIVFSFIVIGFVLKKLTSNSKFLYVLLEKLDFAFYKVLFFVFILMLVNWILEIYRWSVFSGNSLKISTNEVAKSLFIGLILPQELSDLWVKTREKNVSWKVAMLSGLSQTMITFIFGILGMLALGYWYGLLGVFAFFILSLVIFKVLKMFKTYIGFVQYLNELWGGVMISKEKVLKSMIIGSVRYLVFTFQFVLLLKLIVPDLNLKEMVFGFMTMMCLKTILPSAGFMADLGMREFSAYIVFGQNDSSVELVMISSLILWMINVLPISVLGVFFWFKK